MPCPNLSGQRCGLYNSYQEEYQRQTYCLTSDNFLRCSNWKPNSTNCPYFTGDYCKAYGDLRSISSIDHKLNYCLKSANCTNCPNFR
jgi:hypothetical protein